MNLLDTIYYNAISEASEGRLDVSALNPLLNAASKYTVLGEPQEAARHYERLYQLWKAILESGTASDITARQRFFFKNVLSEYAATLEQLGRTGRLEDIRQAVATIED